MPSAAQLQPYNSLSRLGPLFLACSKCGAILHTEHQASRPMILQAAMNPLGDPEPSLELIANTLPMVFTDTGAYAGKVLGVEEDTKLKVVRSDTEELCAASRFVFFLSRAVFSSEPVTLLLMPAWFEDLPQLVHQLHYYEARIRPLLALLVDQKISEACFTMLLSKCLSNLGQADFRKAQFLREAMETEIAKIGVALETLEAQKVVGERSDEEFLLKRSMLSQVKAYLELIVSGIAEATRGALELSRKTRKLLESRSISPTTASKALAVAELLLTVEQRRIRSS